MVQAATANLRRSDRRPDRRRRIPLWATAVTGALVALGFTRARYSGNPDGDDAGMRSKTGTRSGTHSDPDAESERGRFAETPSQITARGWKDILLRVYDNIGRDRVITIAAGVTFYSVLALFPAIAALVSLYGLFADPATIGSHLDSLSGVTPGGGVEVISDQLKRLTSQPNGALGFATIIGLVTALWSANAGIKSLFDALNLVYNEPEKRGIIKLNAISLAFTTATIGFLLIALGAMVVLPQVLGYIGMGGGGMDQIVRIGRWPALLIAVVVWIAAVYRIGPSRDKPRWRWITWGSALAALLWIVVSLLFSWYAAHFGSYNKTYGSLGAAVGLMVWIWLSIIIVLLGAEIDAEMEHQTLRDTTEGPEKPMGRRGARMADTVGRAAE